MARRLFVTLFLAAWAMPLAADAPEQHFVIDVLQVLNGATLHRRAGTTKTAVAVIGRPREAGPMAKLLESKASLLFPALHVVAEPVALPESGDASAVIGNDAVAAIVVQATARSLQALDAFAITRYILTISKRPQDIGKVSVVILPSGEICRDDSHLKDEQITLDAQTIKKSAVRPTTDWESLYLRASILRQQRWTDTDWNEVAKFYQEAILVRNDEDRHPVPSGNGGINDPYVPHFRLSQALAMIGDCDAAREELQHSIPAARKYVRDASEIEKAISSCKPNYAGRDLRQMRSSSWVTNSF